jgi:hypothetical protein
MSFYAKRLRVQLPCVAGSSVFEADPAGFGGIGGLGGACDAGASPAPHSALCPDPPPKPPPPDPPCGVPSNFFPDDPREIWTDVVILGRIPERFVLSAEDLPLLKAQLEISLKKVEIAESLTVRAREQLEKHLRDIDASQRGIKEMQEKG